MLLPGLRYPDPGAASVGDRRVGLFALDFSLVEPNLVCAKDAVVNMGALLFLLRNDVMGDVEFCRGPPVGGDPGEEGETLRLLSDEDRESIGLKH